MFIFYFMLFFVCQCLPFAVSELNVHWLRSNIGYVGQEPVLFSGTIKENITKGNPNATMEEVEAAAKVRWLRRRC
jgi:ABC-type bacteriocin/lantibiotic exporter with double-glycine peptidase domain